MTPIERIKNMLILKPEATLSELLDECDKQNEQFFHEIKLAFTAGRFRYYENPKEYLSEVFDVEHKTNL